MTFETAVQATAFSNCRIIIEWFYFVASPSLGDNNL